MSYAGKILAALVVLTWNVSAALTVTPRGAADRWKIAEFSLAGVPAVANPFDPDLMVVSGTFTAPSGRSTRVEGFWFQEYRATLSGSAEVLTAQGAPEWRLRFLPDESGLYTLSVQATTATTTNSGSITFTAGAGATTNRFKGIPKVAANGKFFEVGAEPLILNGANVCWPGGRGTFDYLDWFPAMKQSDENFARLWMCPWAFGLETAPTTRKNYQLNKAWQLDRTLRIGETNGIWIMLCLEYHGMFQTVADQFGGNNLWPQNPYNSANGGPCATPNEFFTSGAARDVYKKRLRYLVARYGAMPNLFCWEFFNEIDNSYNLLNATAVANWHGALGPWLKAADPYQRLVTTSLTGSSDRAEIWNLPGMEFAQYHSYGEPQPAPALARIAQSMLGKYRKPVLIGEFGIDASGFHAEADPYFRGLRQGVWGGLLGASAGTGMSWWWEEIQARNLYGIYKAARQFLDKSALGQGAWEPVQWVTNGDPPATVGEALAGAAPFDATLPLNAQWGMVTAGALALAEPDSIGRAPAVLNAFFHGTAHADLKRNCRISTIIGAGGGRLTLHLNSVSEGAIINVLVDGASVITQSVPNLDGSFAVNNEYNRDYSVNLTAGKHLIQVRNTGGDWFYLDTVRLENVQPSTYATNWTASPVAIGMKSPAEALVYVLNPAASFPANATVATIPPLTNATIRLTNWSAGAFTALWHDAKTLTPAGKTSGTTTNGLLMLPLPLLREDIVGRIVPANRISSLEFISPTTLKLQLETPAPARTAIEGSTNFTLWREVSPVGFSNQVVTVPFDQTEPQRIFRAVTSE